MKTTQYLYRERDRFWRKQAAAENRFPQTSDFTVLVDLNQPVSNQAGNFQPDRIRSNVNGGEGRHSETV